MRRALAIVALSALVAGCRTTRPASQETPLTALTATSAQDAERQLIARRAQMTPVRSLLRMRITSSKLSLTVRAQLEVGGGRMLLTAYTPFGTTGMRIFAAGDEVTFVNDFEGTWWQGGIAEFGRSFGFFGSASPADIGLLLEGLPAGGKSFVYEFAPTGIARASAGDVVITFDPPSYPPKHISVVRGAQSLDIETLESVMTTSHIEAPVVPANYKCCIAPKM